MSRIILFAALLAVVVLVSGAPAPPATAQDLDVEAMCDLFPDGEGLSVGWTRGDACDAKRGDCGELDERSCVDFRILRLDSAQDARETLASQSEFTETTPVSGLGEAAVEWRNERTYWLWFRRSNYIVFVFAALGQDNAARAILDDIDAALEQALDPAPPAQPDVVEEPADAPQEPTPNLPDFVDVFFGTAKVSALRPRIEEVLQCSDLGEEEAEGCPGTRPAWAAVNDFNERFRDRLPNVTERGEESVDQLQAFTFLAALEGTDGKALFPSVRGAMLVLWRLIDGQLSISTIDRFVGLLAAKDAADWEGRFP